MKTRRITAAALCLIMLFVLLPTAVLAKTNDIVFVGGTDVSGGGYWRNDGSGGITPDGASETDYNVHYATDTNANTLTLNGANITKNYDSFSAAILTNVALTIKLEGENKVQGASGPQSFGIYSMNTVTIDGNGSLTAAGGTASGDTNLISCGVFGASVTISGGTVTAIGGKAAQSYGISSSADVTISGGNVTATGGEATGKSWGVFANTVSITGGTVKATGGTAAGTSNGVYGYDRIAISGGNVTATGGKAAQSFGLYGTYYEKAGSIVGVTIKDSTVTAAGGEATVMSCGVYGANRVTIEDSTLTATANAAFRQSSGVHGGNSVIMKNSTVNAYGGRVGNGPSYGVHGYQYIIIKDSKVTATGGTTSGENSLSGGLVGINVSIEDGTVTATGDTANGEDGLSYGIYGTATVTTSGGTVLSKGNSSAVRMRDEATLSIFDGYTAPHTIAVSESISGLPAVSPAASLGAYKYLRVAPGEATISDVTVSGTQNTAVSELTATIAMMSARFSAMNKGTDVSGWFTNMPSGLNATINADVAAGAAIATVTFSGKPRAASTAAMTVTIPADVLNSEQSLTVTSNANAKWSIAASPYDSCDNYDYSPPQVTVYNDPSKPNATIQLTGSGLAPDDMLITKRDPEGKTYSLLCTVAGENEVFATYDISLKSGSKSTGSSMYLTFDIAAKYAGQPFTLVHQKADGTYEYFYAVADVNGDLTFGPLYELSPFMLVKGTLAQTVYASISDVPKTGDSAQPAIKAALALMMAAALLTGIALRKRRKQP